MAKIIATTQYYENYNVNEEGFGKTPYWKPKGEFTFHFPIEFDALMYTSKSDMVIAIKSLITKVNTDSDAERFEYISHEVEITTPYLVDGLLDEIIKINQENEETLTEKS